MRTHRSHEELRRENENKKKLDSLFWIRLIEWLLVSHSASSSHLCSNTSSGAPRHNKSLRNRNKNLLCFSPGRCFVFLCSFSSSSSSSPLSLLSISLYLYLTSLSLSPSPAPHLAPLFPVVCYLCALIRCGDESRRSADWERHRHKGAAPQLYPSANLRARCPPPAAPGGGGGGANDRTASV